MDSRARICDVPSLLDQKIGFAAGQLRQSIGEITGHYNCWEVNISAPAEWLDAEFVIRGITMGISCEIGRLLGRDILGQDVSSNGNFSGKLLGVYGRFFDKVTVDAIRITPNVQDPPLPAFRQAAFHLRGWCQGATAADRNGPAITQPFAPQNQSWDFNLANIPLATTVFRTAPVGRRDNITSMVITGDDSVRRNITISRRGPGPGGNAIFSPAASMIASAIGLTTIEWTLSMPLRGLLSAEGSLATWEVTLDGIAGTGGTAITVVGYTE